MTSSTKYHGRITEGWKNKQGLSFANPEAEQKECHKKKEKHFSLRPCDSIICENHLKGVQKVKTRMKMLGDYASVYFTPALPQDKISFLLSM